MVQLVVAMACRAPCRAAKACSNAATFGPCVSQPVSSGSRSARHSSSPVSGLAICITRSGIGRRGDAPAPLDFLDMRFTPGNQLAQTVVEPNGSAEVDLLGSTLRAANPIAHKCRLTTRRVLDRLIAAGER